MTIEFKTISDCRVELVAYTVRANPDGDYMPSSDRYVSPANDLPARAARASYGNEDKTGKDVKADNKLMGFLAEHEHMTPFEYNHAVFYVECPLFVLSQIKTHRTQKSLDLATNVISRRYTSEKISFWIPDKWRKQSESSKQASTNEPVNDEKFAFRRYERAISEVEKAYYDLLGYGGVCREQARAVLPEALITSMYIGGTLRNWAGFIELRSSENVQEETRVIAERIEKALKELWPNATEYLFQ